MDVDEVSELFRRGFQTMYKSSLLGQSVQDRKTILSDFRREKRSTLAFQNRNIDVNMSPINTPKVGRHVETVEHKDKRANDQNPVKNKRLEMLAEWKKQKAQQKVIEKTKNAKPVFKVTHVKSSVKSDIDTANQFIKGKPIPFNVTHSWGIQPDHQFKFKAPNLIKAPNFNQNIHQNKARNEKKIPIEKPKVNKAGSVTKATIKEVKPLRTTKAPDLNKSSNSKIAEKVQSKYSLRNRNFPGTTKRLDNKIDTKCYVDVAKKIDNKRQIVKSAESRNKTESQKLVNKKVIHKSLEKTHSQQLAVNVVSERITPPKKSVSTEDIDNEEVFGKPELAENSAKDTLKLETPSKVLMKSSEKTPVDQKENGKQLVVNVVSESFTTPEVSTEDIDDEEVFIKPESAKMSDKKDTLKPETPSKELMKFIKKTLVSKKGGRKQLVVNVVSESFTTPKKSVNAEDVDDDKVFIKPESAKKSAKKGTSRPETPSKVLMKPSKRTPVSKKGGRKQLVVNVVSENFTTPKEFVSTEDIDDEEVFIKPESAKKSAKKDSSKPETPSKVLMKPSEKTPVSKKGAREQLVVNVLSENFTAPKKFVSTEDIDNEEVFIKPESAKKSAKKDILKPETPSNELMKSNKKTPVSKNGGRNSSARLCFEFPPKQVDTSNHEVFDKSETDKLDSELSSDSIIPSNTKNRDPKVFKSSGKKTSTNSMGRRQSARRSAIGTPKELNIADDVMETHKTDSKLFKTIESKENITPNNTKIKVEQSVESGEKTPVNKSSKSRRSLKQNSINHTSNGIITSDDELVTNTKPKSPTHSDKLTDLTENAEIKPLRISNENVTPKKPVDTGEEVFYISPHVTFARGKDAARKEYKMRLSTGGSLPDTPEFSRSVIEATTPRAGAAFFSHKLDEEVARIERLCLEWEDYREDPALPAEAHDSIDVAIGQSKLLVAKKFGQFRGLIGKCRTQTNDDENDRPVTCQDLHGFWDMMYMQIEDVDKRFQNLCRLRENSWHELLPQKNEPAEKKRGRGRPKKTVSAASSKLREAIKAARQKKKQAVTEAEEMKEVQEEKVFEGGYFEVRSPIHEVVPQANRSDRSKANLRRSAIMSEAKKRCSLSPGLAMMSVSSSIKLGNGLTPSKSILKSTGSTVKNTKSVIFSDEVNKSIVKIRLFAEGE